MSGLFTHRKLNDEGMRRYKAITEEFEMLLAALDADCFGPAGGREFALAKTHLEIACMFAKKAMCAQTINQDNS